MPDEDVELLHVNGETFDPDDLTYGERREVRRLIRAELWDDDEGEFDWDEVGENEVLPATIAVFMARAGGAAKTHLSAALKLKPRDVYAKPEVPPTSSPRASGRAKKSGAAGSRT